MAKIYTTQGRILYERPQIQIGNKLYTVDNRQSTFKKLEKQLTKDANDMEKVFEIVFGAEEAKEIIDMDLSYQGTVDLVIYIFAAIKGIEFEEAEKEFFRKEG